MLVVVILYSHHSMASNNNVVVSNSKQRSTSKPEYYAVAKGIIPGIYGDWSKAKAQVEGFPDNTHKKFTTLTGAKNFMRKAGIINPQLFINLPSPKNTKSNISNNFPIDMQSITQTPTPRSNMNRSFDNKSPLPESFNTPINTNNNSFAVLDSIPDEDAEVRGTIAQPNISASTPSNKCTNCTDMQVLLHSLIKRVEKLESAQHSYTSTQSQLNDQLNRVESLANHYTTNNGAFEFKLAELSAKIDSLTAAIGSNSKQVSTHVPPKKITNLSQITTPKPAVRSLPANPPTQSFEPTKCIVVSSTNNEKDEFRSLNQDQIRRAISTDYGPIIIDSIRRYKFNTANPRYIVQLGSASDVDILVEKWKTGTLGGSSIRGTIKPSESFVGMMRGVPLDIDTKSIQSSVDDSYRHTNCFRLSKNDNPLRTVKITFANSCDLTKAIETGITLSDYNMRFRVELPYSASSPKINNGV